MRNTLLKSETSGRILRRDVILMLALTVLYAFFAFWHLGSMRVPESGFYVQEKSEQVVLDFDMEKTVASAYIYAGWMDRRSGDNAVERILSVEYSTDGMHWEAGEPFVLSAIWRWHRFEVGKNARFVRLSFDDARAYINEIAFFGNYQDEQHEIVRVFSQNSTKDALIDEQDKVSYEYSWYENTYFDEIYHPRTAYEHITGRTPYENTHPPLGKLVIALGMLIFGVNPFGWRFFGTLCGVFMVPMVYVMGKKMLKSTPFAFFAASVFCFDFMHLTQTRLATIDSYTAFFVMGAYLFMFLSLERDFTEVGTRKMLSPLFCSGLFFGFAAATKWQGIYAGFGLAPLYFWHLWRCGAKFRKNRNIFRENGAKSRNEYKISAQNGELKKEAAYVKQVASLLGFGALFFVVVPAVIYFLSYIPAMRSEGVSYFFTNQASMLSYHGNLTATHPYSSKFWQWPFDFKPLYLYAPDRNFVPEGTSMGLTTFGNPLVWWLSLPMLLWGIYDLIRHRKNPDLSVLVSVAGFLALYVPWFFVSRAAFIYHFFPCVVFFVLLLSRLLQRAAEKRAWVGKAMWGYAALVFILFVAYYPVLVGIPVPTAYVEILRLFPGWVLG